MIYSICNEKGGSGKTTLAINLATKLNAKSKTLLIDLDPQKSINAFLSFRDENKMPFDFKSSNNEELQSLLTQALQNYTNIVIDTGGRDSKEMRSAMIYSDICSITTIPNGIDASVLDKMLDYLKKAKKIQKNLKGFVLISKANSNPFLQNKIKEFQDFLKSKNTKKDFCLLDSILYEREAYKESILQGKGITENSKNSKKAQEEFLQLFQELERNINGNK